VKATNNTIRVLMLMLATAVTLDLSAMERNASSLMIRAIVEKKIVEQSVQKYKLVRSATTA